MERTDCPIWGSAATLLSPGRYAAVRRIDSSRAGGVYEITFQADELLARPDLVTADHREAITKWLNSQRVGGDDNPPVLTREVIREVTEQSLL